MVKVVKQKHGGSLKIAEKGDKFNPKGRPRKGASLILHQLKELGITTMNKSQVEDIYLQMLQLTDEELEKIFKDKTQPTFVKVIASNLRKKEKNFQVLESMLDRSIGKPIQTTKSEVEVTTIDLTDEEKELIYNQLKANGLINENIK